MRKLLRFLWLAIQLKREYVNVPYEGLTDIFNYEVPIYESSYNLRKIGMKTDVRYIVAPYSLKGAQKLTRVPKRKDVAHYTTSANPDGTPIWFCKRGLRKRFFHVPKAIYFKEVTNG